MTINVGSTIEIKNPSKDVVDYCLKNLVIINPEYEKKRRMGFWTGNTPQRLYLYQNRGSTWILPYGCRDDVITLTQEGDSCSETFSPETFRDAPFISPKGNKQILVDLYPYQTMAILEMAKWDYGILQAPAGSGKTQIGIALAAALSKKTLWITHTKDLLLQSESRAEQFIDSSLLGTITEGKIQIGECMTFATVQTLCKVDLASLKDEWNIIIVDECHRVAGSPTSVTQFSKVLNSLAAKRKYGLSATVHRADGLIQSTFSLLGPVRYKISDADVKDTTEKARIVPRFTGIRSDFSCEHSDGTLDFQRTLTYLIGKSERNEFILSDLKANFSHSILVLSSRTEHLNELFNSLPETMVSRAAYIDGKTKKEVRKVVLDKMRSGDLNILFATYSLAKEGLDIPRLDRLFLVTPQKDEAIVIQSVGRIERRFDGKDSPKVYDYIDHIKTFEKWWKLRQRIYRKIGCEIEKT